MTQFNINFSKYTITDNNLDDIKTIVIENINYFNQDIDDYNYLFDFTTDVKFTTNKEGDILHISGNGTIYIKDESWIKNWEKNMNPSIDINLEFKDLKGNMIETVEFLSNESVEIF